MYQYSNAIVTFLVLKLKVIYASEALVKSKQTT